MILKNIPILSDNYVWILLDHCGFCIIIDPGLSEPIIQEIKIKKWHPIAILLTHDHIDHTKGVKNIVKNYPKIIVFGPDETKKNGVNKIVSGGDKLILLQKTFHVFSTPGHTMGHVSYYMRPYFFCGDTLFSGGCGSVYKTKYLEMYNSIQFISSFPNETILCCSHEYTLSNLYFSIFILPEDKSIKIYFKKIKKVLEDGKSSLPSFLSIEKKFNLFLRTNENILRDSMRLNKRITSFEVFVLLRKKKDVFVGAKRD